ncbi:unnamed protein product [Candida parapsilosis]
MGLKIKNSKPTITIFLSQITTEWRRCENIYKHILFCSAVTWGASTREKYRMKCVTL